MRQIIICPNCGQEKEHWAKGLCRTCYQREWSRGSESHKEKAREYSKKHHQGLVGKLIVCQACGLEKAHCANGLCTECYGKLSRQDPEHKARHAELERKRRAEKGESYVRTEKKRSQSKKRKEWERKYNYEYYRKHQDKLKAYAIEYRKADSSRQTIYKARRRNRVKGLEATLTPEQWQEILEKYNYSCYYCGRTDLPLEMEHKIPASRNGGLTEDNIVPSCGPCNRSKKTMTLEEFADWLEKVGRSHQFHPSTGTKSSAS